MKKGDIFKFENYKERGLTNNCYFYCKGVLDDEAIIVRCIITQSGNILLHNTIVDISDYKDELIPTTVEEFIKNKSFFEENSPISFSHLIYDNGIIRDIDENNKKLSVEVENEGICEYVDISINFDDVLIVYPEFTFNDRQQFK